MRATFKRQPAAQAMAPDAAPEAWPAERLERAFAAITQAAGLMFYEASDERCVHYLARGHCVSDVMDAMQCMQMLRAQAARHRRRRGGC